MDLRENGIFRPEKKISLTNAQFYPPANVDSLLNRPQVRERAVR